MKMISECRYRQENPFVEWVLKTLVDSYISSIPYFAVISEVKTMTLN